MVLQLKKCGLKKNVLKNRNVCKKANVNDISFFVNRNIRLKVLNEVYDIPHFQSLFCFVLPFHKKQCYDSLVIPSKAITPYSLAMSHTHPIIFRTRFIYPNNINTNG